MIRVRHGTPSSLGSARILVTWRLCVGLEPGYVLYSIGAAEAQAIFLACLVRVRF